MSCIVGATMDNSTQFNAKMDKVIEYNEKLLVRIEDLSKSQQAVKDALRNTQAEVKKLQNKASEEQGQLVDGEDLCIVDIPSDSETSADIHSPRSKKRRTSPKTETPAEIQFVGADSLRKIVAIRNTGNDLISLEGWEIYSCVEGKSFNFPACSVRGGQTIYIVAGTAKLPRRLNGKRTLWKRQLIWNRDADILLLLNQTRENVGRLEIKNPKASVHTTEGKQLSWKCSIM